MLYKNRILAGAALAAALVEFKGAAKTVVLGLPRGGVVVAGEVAEALSLPLDILVPRKLGAPGNPELAIGAVAFDTVVLDAELIAALEVPQSYIDAEIAREKKEAARRLALFRAGKPEPNWRGWTVLVVDDGIATGSTMRASIAAVKKKGAARIVAAVPVGPPDTIRGLKKDVEVVCLYEPPSFMAVGQFYESFPQTSDEEVIRILSRRH